MSHKIAYILATLMIFAASAILYVNQNAVSLLQRLSILSYMIIYGALMAWSEKK